MNSFSPDLTFACELEAQPLVDLFANPAVIPFLQTMKATVAMGMTDLSEGRAEVVRCLNQKGVPVTAWLLLPRDQGYWFNLDNYQQAAARYEQFRAWSLANDLQWARVGLDIEPDIRVLGGLSNRRVESIARLISHTFDTLRLRRGSRAYQVLVDQIHADGYQVETYQIPFLVDERIAHSSLLQRLTGLVDLPNADREILMLYSSFLRPWGQGVLWSYAPHAHGIGVGTTGRGMETELSMDVRPLSWAELQTDLLLARRHTENIFVYSLEGCVQQNFLPLLEQMSWQEEVKLPVLYSQRVNTYRDLARRILWMFSRPAWLLFALALAISAIVVVNRRSR